jgi:prepilin-type N-terminal cleavage/methylation domain-containing protein
MEKNTQNNKGFTLIEMVISIFLLCIAIIGVFSFFSMVLILTSDAGNRLTAAYLAQEGMEITRNIRDSNWLQIDNGQDVKWDDGLICNTVSCDWQTDYVSKNLFSYTSENYLYFDANNFYVQQATGKKTKFIRKITTSKVTDVNGNNDHILMVKVEVSWDEKPNILNFSNPGVAGYCQLSNCVTTEETLYDWYKYNQNVQQ